MKTCRALLLSCFVLANSAFANTFMSDYSDLWWNANESGWGVTITHQREVAFFTFFIYGQDGRASWYTGQTTYTGKSALGEQIFTGSVYLVSGSWFAGSFSPTLVSVRQVGTLTFTAYLESANLTYTIDGITVNKKITRQTFCANDVTGNYQGAIKQIQSGCTPAIQNGEFDTNVIFNVIQVTNLSFYMTASLPTGGYCTYNGDYTQNGKLGASNGTYDCPGGLFGTYSFFELEAGISGLTGRYTARNNFCPTVSGRFGAMRK